MASTTAAIAPPFRVLTCLVAADMSGAWMSLRDKGGELNWEVISTGAGGSELWRGSGAARRGAQEEVTVDSLRIALIADVTADPDNSEVFTVSDAHGKTLRVWDLGKYPPHLLNPFMQTVAAARLPDLYGLAWARDDASVEKCEAISQLGQDLWVLQVLGAKRDGFFVDVGAGDGLLISNSLRLERDFGWDGIAVEPSRQFESLERNRRCTCVNECIGNENEEVVYVEDYLHGEHNHFSGIKKYNDCHQQQGSERTVKTRSLTSILREKNAPKVIDFLSIDTEGSELVILQGLEFEEYTFRTIALEHNFVEAKRQQMHDLLTTWRYERIPIAASRWDDYYIHHSQLRRK